MSVWVCVPSKRPPAEVKLWAEAWKDQGYKIALWRDDNELCNSADIHLQGTKYPGYAQATNTLIPLAIEDYGARWCIIGGDDVFPDTTKRADEIAQECAAHFQKLRPVVSHQANYSVSVEDYATFGVMQPTGQRWGENPQSIAQYGPDRAAYIDRICGSAFLGREFCLRINNGNGPLWPEFFHMHVDEALQCVAEKLGILWQRRDLTHDHRHWANGENRTRAEHMPDFLRYVNTDEHWQDSLKILNRLKAEGFKRYLEMAP